MKMLEALVESVSLFGAEIWGWRKEERLDGIQRKYVKWILGLERTTPNYIVVEEGKLVKIKEKALKRALKYEEKIGTTRKKLVEECWKERKKEWGAGREGKWARIRRKILEEEGDGTERREGSREEEENTVQKIIGKIREKEKAERRKKIEESTYNREYKKIIKEERAEYLSKRMKQKDRKTIARFRCGNEAREKEYWKAEEEKVCRLCKKEVESMWHVLKECEKTGQKEEIEKVLGEDGQGLIVLRRIEEERKKAAEEG
ncbi:uncharacterized protein [Polyergus mexicanus]|uniref:uncharacterized protein n=1 Tax=Polyergus mexicanus TaxID=615972 RepID=UPI0038B621E2